MAAVNFYVQLMPILNPRVAISYAIILGNRLRYGRDVPVVVASSYIIAVMFFHVLFECAVHGKRHLAHITSEYFATMYSMRAHVAG